LIVRFTNLEGHKHRQTTETTDDQLLTLRDPCPFKQRYQFTGTEVWYLCAGCSWCGSNEFLWRKVHLWEWPSSYKTLPERHT